MNSTPATSGIAATRALRSWIWTSAALSASLASMFTFDSVKSRAALRPVWMIQKPASSRSISTIVAVAARLISALRQKPCHARLRLKPMNEITSVCPVVRATDLVADDPTLLERHDALPQRGDDVGVVGRHEHGHAKLVDPQKQLQDLPADERVEVAGGFVGDDEARVVDERARD